MSDKLFDKIESVFCKTGNLEIFLFMHVKYKRSFFKELFGIPSKRDHFTRLTNDVWVDSDTFEPLTNDKLKIAKAVINGELDDKLLKRQNW